MCEHVTHPEHWPGDVGDLYAADPRGHVAATFLRASDMALDHLAAMLCIDGTAARSLRDAPYGTCVP